MSDTATLTEEDFERIRAMKEDAAERAPERGTDDMNGFIELWRDGKPILVLFTPDVDRDQVLDAAWFAIPAIDADRAIVVMDAHLSTAKNNPNTGEPWGPGEMQKACHEDGACLTGIITDCLIVNDIWRDGTYRMNSLMYHIDEPAKAAGDQPVSVHWQKDEDTANDLSTAEGVELGGLVPDVLRKAFERDMNVDMPEDIRQMEQEMGAVKARAAKDAAAVGRLVMQGYGVALMHDDPEWFEIVNDLLNGLSEAMGFNVQTSGPGEEFSE